MKPSNVNMPISAVWLIVFFSNVFTHLTNDFFVFWEWAKNIRYIGDTGISALSSSWDIKGLFARAFYLQLYDITNIIQDGFFSLKSMYIYKSIGLIELNLILFISIFILPQNIIKTAVEKLNLFFFIGAMIMAVSFIAHLQPEFIAIYILILSLCLYLNGKYLSKFCGGIIFSIVFFLKSPLALMGGSIFFSALLIKDDNIIKEIKSFLPYILGWIISFSIALFYIKIYAPLEISDMVDASYYQSTLIQNIKATPHAVFNCFISLFRYCWYIPAITLGIILLCFNIKNKIRDRKWTSLIYEILVWFFPLLFITISNCFFPYHYMILLFPSIVTTIEAKKVIINIFAKDWNKVFLISMISFGIIGYLVDFSFINHPLPWMLLSCLLVTFAIITKYEIWIIRVGILLIIFIYSTAWSAYAHKTIDENRFYKTWCNTSKYIDTTLGNRIDNNVLFLDGGIGAFILNNKSYLRHSYPLPIERINEKESPFIERSTFISTEERILNYNGDYITLDNDWFFHYPHNKIRHKIEREYQVYDSIKTFSFSYGMYDLPQNGMIYLLKRK